MRISIFTLISTLLLACGPDDFSGYGTSSDTGDLGNTTDGDGDGDPTGDGDGDPTTDDGDESTSDGDPTTGDGDGDPTSGDGDDECECDCEAGPSDDCAATDSGICLTTCGLVWCCDCRWCYVVKSGACENPDTMTQDPAWTECPYSSVGDCLADCF